MSQILNFLNVTYNHYIVPRSQSAPPAYSYSTFERSLSTSSSLKERLDAACQSPTSTLANCSAFEMRHELDLAKRDLARALAESSRLEERCKMLEKTLKETRHLLRSREADLEAVRRERDREKAMSERRRSDAGPSRHQSLDVPGQRASTFPRVSSSLDTSISSSELRQMYPGRLYLRDSLRDSLARRTPSPSRSSLSTSTNLSTSSSGFSVGQNGSNGGNIISNTEEERARFLSTESYMTRIDSLSGAQVLQAVRDINIEILQFAAATTEICKFASPASSSNPKLSQVITDTSLRIGPSITQILVKRDHSQEPLLVQIALQGCLSLCIARAIHSFCIGYPPKSDAILSEIYTHMQLTEPQPTSSKWRALAHHHIHALYPTLTDYSITELSDTILRWCADIFQISNAESFTNTSVSSNSSVPQTPATQLRSLFLDQVRRISASVMRLASVIREEIMSTSFAVFIADPSSPFDEGEMTDHFGEYGASRGAILATMEVGLKCVTRINVNPSQTVEANSGGSLNIGDGRLESRILLHPRVVLESVLEVLDR